MMKKQISKISMLASLLVATMVNAQEFYTCVPKKSWWSDVMSNSVAQGIKEEKKQSLKIIHLTPKSKQEEFMQVLEPGRYRITATAAGGEIHKQEFLIAKPSVFKACVGERGEDGCNGGYYGEAYCPSNGDDRHGGGGMGYKGRYSKTKDPNYNADDGIGYDDFPKSYAGKGGRYAAIGNNSGSGGTGGTGCYGGGGGGAGCGAGGGGGGGSYFAVADIELILKGADGANGTCPNYYGYGGKGGGPDGYIKIEKFY